MIFFIYPGRCLQRPLELGETESTPKNDKILRRYFARTATSIRNKSNHRSRELHKSFLDALRGIAAFSVLIQHAIDFYIKDKHIATAPALEAIAQDQIHLGRFGVVLFFILSGYLIPPSLSSRKESKPRALAKFGIRRTLRIYPAFWVCLLIACISNWVCYGKFASAEQILLNATMLPSLFHAKPVLGLYWTLAIELLFYCFCAMVFLLNRNILSNKWISVLTSLVFAAACVIPITLNHYTQTNIPEQYISLHFSALFLGNSIRLFEGDGSNIFLLSNVIGFLLASAIASGVAFEHPSNLNPLGGNGFFHGDVLAIALFFLANRSKADWPKPMIEMGTISYSIYLIHWPVTITTALIPQLQDNPALHVLTIIVVTMAASKILYELIESPAINLSRSITNRI